MPCLKDNTWSGKVPSLHPDGSTTIVDAKWLPFACIKLRYEDHHGRHPFDLLVRGLLTPQVWRPA